MELPKLTKFNSLNEIVPDEDAIKAFRQKMQVEADDHQKKLKERNKKELRRFRIPITVAIVIFIINACITIYYNVTDITSDLLKEQVRINAEQLQQLQETKQVLFRIEENGLQVEGTDTLTD